MDSNIDNTEHDNNAKLHQQILDFYNAGVSDNYATRCVEFYHQKRKSFRWLFEGKDRIKLSISDEEAIDFFFTYNQQFQSLFYGISEFFHQMNSQMPSQEIKLAIFKNRIQYDKNEYKFTKFYNRFVKTESDPEVDFQAFYDKLKTAEVVLSIHPMDFLRASENSSFSSCLSLDSCHHTSTTAYLRDSITIMAYTTDGSKKLGRQWIYFDGYYVVLGNIYGSISRPLQEKIRKLIEEKYAKHLGIANKWVISRGKTIEEENLCNCGHGSNDHGEYAVYFDQEVNSAIRHKEKTHGFDNLDLEFEEGMDRYGDDTSSGYLGLTYCSCCNDAIEGESTYTEDGEVCDYCLNNYYSYCSECERYHHENTTMNFIEDENNYLCESCYDEGDYGFCEKTECYYTRDKLVEVIESDGTLITVHEDYAAENYHFCDICERFFENPTTETADGFCVCGLCLEKDYELVEGSYEFKTRQVA
ncbi:MAG: hypothetical protein P9L97_11995 [Candidatus Tenebribacter davisii]|nr:hypothetical protein [Candidatus Tenebribacter davisii]